MIYTLEKKFTREELQKKKFEKNKKDILSLFLVSSPIGLKSIPRSIVQHKYIEHW